MNEAKTTIGVAPTQAADKHTPGPWRIETNGDGRSFYVAEGNVHVGVFGFPERRKNAEANARLIAAAPELLDVCRALIAVMHSGNESLDIKARALLDKAEGRTV